MEATGNGRSSFSPGKRTERNGPNRLSPRAQHEERFVELFQANGGLAAGSTHALNPGRSGKHKHRETAMKTQRRRRSRNVAGTPVQVQGAAYAREGHILLSLPAAVHDVRKGGGERR